jgi:ribosomal protein L29
MAKRKQEQENKSIPEMEAAEAQLEKEIFDLRNQLAVHRKLEQPHLLRAKRHERARLLTILTQQRRKVT